MERDVIITMILILLLILVVGGIALVFLPDEFGKVFGFARGVFNMTRNDTADTYAFVEESKEVLELCSGSHDSWCACSGKLPGLPEGFFIVVENKGNAARVTAFSEDQAAIGNTQIFNGYKIGVALPGYNERQSVVEGMPVASYADGLCHFKDSFIIRGDYDGRASIKLGGEEGAFYPDLNVADIMKVGKGEYCLVTENIAQEDFTKEGLGIEKGIWVAEDDYIVIDVLEDLLVKTESETDVEVSTAVSGKGLTFPVVNTKKTSKVALPDFSTLVNRFKGDMATMPVCSSAKNVQWPVGQELIKDMRIRECFLDDGVDGEGKNSFSSYRISVPAGSGIYSISGGKVEKAEADEVIVSLAKYDSLMKAKYSGIGKVKVKAGDTLKKGQLIGTTGQDVGEASFSLTTYWEIPLEKKKRAYPPLCELPRLVEDAYSGCTCGDFNCYANAIAYAYHCKGIKTKILREEELK
ncbi:MAG: M23 family metallopeptidase [Candidatus Woesearchaeota archaeon]